MIKQKNKQSERYNKNAKKNEIEYKEGQLVYMYLHNKFKKIWEPGTIIKKMSNPRS